MFCIAVGGKINITCLHSLLTFLFLSISLSSFFRSLYILALTIVTYYVTIVTALLLRTVYVLLCTNPNPNPNQNPNPNHNPRSEEHTSELQSRPHLVCRLLLEKKKKLSDG